MMTRMYSLLGVVFCICFFGIQETNSATTISVAYTHIPPLIWVDQAQHSNNNGVNPNSTLDNNNKQSNNANDGNGSFPYLSTASPRKAACFEHSHAVYSTEGNLIHGMMSDVLLTMVQECEAPDSVLSFDTYFPTEHEVEMSAQNAVYSLPVSRTMVRHSFYGNLVSGEVFLPVFESPGILYIAARGFSSTTTVSAALSAWPLLIIIYLSSGIAGTIVWILERLTCSEEFRLPFVTGFFDGTWWALVSMTTVGYGDKKPASLPGRVFASAWILVGLVIIALFTATLSSAFQDDANQDGEIRGHLVGVVNGTVSEELAYVNGAEPVAFATIDQLVEEALTNENLQGVLVEGIQALFYSSILANAGLFPLRQLPHPLVHGIIVRDRNINQSACLAKIAHKSRHNHLRKVQQIGCSGMMKAKKGVRSSNRMSAMVGMDTIMTVTLAAVLVAMFIVSWLVDVFWVRKHDKSIDPKAKSDNVNELKIPHEKDDQTAFSLGQIIT